VWGMMRLMVRAAHPKTALKRSYLKKNEYC
jgi:hypothetical protein